MTVEVLEKTLAIIMGGGAGTRLFPLTKDRAKPAVPLAGKYRLVDVPISNCINSGIRHIYLLTQFNSTSLHRHINAAYKFDTFTSSFVEILAAQQTPQSTRWYQGTADAVRQNMRYFLGRDYEYYVILSGDQLYQMDVRAFLHQHIQTGADLTIATLPVPRDQAGSLGIMQSDESGRIRRFEEKPDDEDVLDSLKMPQSMLESQNLDPSRDHYQASMGIYVFSRAAMERALKNKMKDFGKNIIPRAIREQKVHAYVFQGYWEDIGTIGSFFQANLDLVKPLPQYSFFNRKSTIFTNARFLPASKINGARVKHAIISDGCIIDDADIENSVIGLRSIIKAGTEIRDCVIMGSDRYDLGSPELDDGLPPIGIGAGTKIERAIIDKNARIGSDVVITPVGKPMDLDAPDQGYYIRDGVVVIPKNAIIPDGTWI